MGKEKFQTVKSGSHDCQRQRICDVWVFEKQVLRNVTSAHIFTNTIVGCCTVKIYKEMTKESIIELQKIDCNCNDCKHLVRDFEKYKSSDGLYTNEKGQVTNPSHRFNYGNCQKLGKAVSFIPNTCQLETQGCFEHRRVV